MITKPRVQICICTCNRPTMVRDALQSIAKMKFPETCDVVVSVIENEENRISEPIIIELKQNFPVPLNYHCEPRRGIPVARNHALGIVLAEGADYLVFIDDDEQVDKEWLQQLYTYAIDQGGNAIIYGRVDRSYPDEAPSYLRHCFKNKQCHPTGSQLNSCATDNVLIPVKIISELNLRFDESRPLAGGTDDLFFRDAVHKGATIFSNAEAIVCETIPLSRASLKWITKRKVRVGISMAPRRRKRFRFALSFLTLTTCRILLRLMACVILFLSGQKMAGITKWLKVCRSFGMICGVMGINYNEYRQIHGE